MSVHDANLRKRKIWISIYVDIRSWSILPHANSTCIFTSNSSYCHGWHFCVYKSYHTRLWIRIVQSNMLPWIKKISTWLLRIRTKAEAQIHFSFLFLMTLTSIAWQQLSLKATVVFKMRERDDWITINHQMPKNVTTVTSNIQLRILFY